MLSDAIKNIESFHENFSKFLQIVDYLQQSINSIVFCNKFCDDCVILWN